MRRRKNDIHLMLDDDELDKLDKLCSFSILSRSTVIRSLIKGAVIQEKTNLDFRSAARAMDRIGNNINMICHHANLTGNVSKEEVDELRQCVSELRGEVYDLKDNEHGHIENNGLDDIRRSDDYRKHK